MRLTIQPFDDPDEQSQVETIIGEIGSDKMLLFSTDYPHWHFEGATPCRTACRRPDQEDPGR